MSRVLVGIFIAFFVGGSNGYFLNVRNFKPIPTALSTATLKNTIEFEPAALNSDEPKFSLNELRKAIPQEAFEKSLPKSLSYMFFDYSMWALAFAAIKALKDSAIWATLPFVAQAGASLLYWNVAGFFMWCIFVVGHDCGHGTFSNNKWLNDILGHITHGSILVPFFPWQLSHRRHHMYHNHIEKDYSYLWYTPDKLEQPTEGMARHFHENPILTGLFPFYGWFMYILLGIRDGNHFVPLKNQKMWQGTPKIEYLKCLLSAAVVGLFGFGNYMFFGQNLANMAFYYLAPLVVFGWWLVTVTYLQHHHEDSVVYDEHDWNFVDSAFETVDRKFGLGIDRLHHHITDGHVAHHLFFTQIPHYNLPIATKAIKSFLAKNNAFSSYRFEKTFDFPLRVHKYLVQFGFKARRADPSGVETA